VELRRLRDPGLARALTLPCLPAWTRRRGAALAALGVLTVLRLVVAGTTPVSPDEAYYWVWSKALAPGYLDHPPMVALWIRLGTLLAGDTPLGIRLLAPIAVALGSLLLADAATRLVRVPGSGVLAAALLNATLLFGVGGVVMTPDTPLLFFWVGAMAAMARLSRPELDDRGRAHGAWFVAAGLCVGLAFASKYTAVMLAFGAGLWVFLVPALRRRLGTPWPWLGGAAALMPALPVLWWNAQHGWASFAKQGGRASDFQPARAVQFLAELVLGQVGLATPLVFWLCAAGLVLAVRRTWQRRTANWTLLAALGVPSVLLFVQHALGDRVQGNWPAIIYPGAAVAAAALGAPRWRRLHGPAVVLGVAITGVVYAQVLWAPLPLPPRRDPLTLQLAGWRGLADAVEAARRREGADFVAAENYGLASELALQLPRQVAVLGVEPRWALFSLPPGGSAGRVGILVRRERRGDPPEHADWSEIVPVGEAVRSAAGAEVEIYRLYRVVGQEGGRPSAALPR
jgi:4-amino-4-deoxy-L-arabinose transferase-like glycosyltransferase